jgi:hypothetical protein
MDMSRPEYELLLVFGPRDLRTKIAFFAWLKRIYFGKNIFLKKCLPKAETCFRFFFYAIDLFWTPISKP